MDGEHTWRRGGQVDRRGIWHWNGRGGPEEPYVLRIIRHEALGIQSRQDRIAPASPSFLILRIGRSGGRYDQRKVRFLRCLCGRRRLQRRATVRFDVFVSALALLYLEPRSLSKLATTAPKLILPHPPSTTPP